MKKSILALICVLCTGLSWNSIYAQGCDNGALQPPCNPQIAFNAIVVDTFLEVSNPNLVCYWVCNGDSLFLNGAANCLVYAEKNAWVRVLGGENYVWLLDGATCQIDMGSSSNFVHRLLSTTLIDNGNLTLDSICTTLNYDYSNAPPNACISTGSFNFELNSSLSIFPNPSDGILTFEDKSGTLSSARLELYTIQGQLIMVRQLQFDAGIHRLQLTGLIPGLFLARISAKEGEMIRKLVLR